MKVFEVGKKVLDENIDFFGECYVFSFVEHKWIELLDSSHFESIQVRKSSKKIKEVLKEIVSLYEGNPMKYLYVSTNYNDTDIGMALTLSNTKAFQHHKCIRVNWLD